jgi:lactate 2-monooxygenase
VLKNYTTDPVFRRLAGSDDDPQADVRTWVQTFGNPLAWADLDWLRSLTDLPIVLKGICHPEDARRAVDAGMDGIYCSNHGGRQANGGLSALEVLPAVVDACDDRVPVLFDSGVRSGSDVVKAIGLGATMVGIGRPYVYGLALGGVSGLIHVLRMLLAEADLLMAVNGYRDIASVRANIQRVS